MRNHVHLLVETREANLGAGMGRLHTLYAQGFNRAYGRCGHVFQGRFGSVLMRSDEQVITTARYIALNPVEAGLCDTADAWLWGSHAALVRGGGPAWLDRAKLLAHFGAGGGDPRRVYEQFVRGSAPRA
jgi:hypothetical protein